MRFAEFTPFHILQLSVFSKGPSLYLHQKLQVDIYIIFVIWHVTQCAQPIILFNMFMIMMIWSRRSRRTSLKICYFNRGMNDE